MLYDQNDATADPADLAPVEKTTKPAKTKNGQAKPGRTRTAKAGKVFRVPVKDAAYILLDKHTGTFEPYNIGADADKAGATILSDGERYCLLPYAPISIKMTFQETQ